MSISIVATVGAASANSFVTEAEAVAYIGTRLNNTATAAANARVLGWRTVNTGETPTETEKKALCDATRLLSLLEYYGSRCDDTQALAWPRNYVTNPDSPLGTLYTSSEIPLRVKNATSELALQMLKLGNVDVTVVDPNEYKLKTKVDVIETEFIDPRLRARGLERFGLVRDFLAPLRPAISGSVRLVR